MNSTVVCLRTASWSKNILHTLVNVPMKLWMSRCGFSTNRDALMSKSWRSDSSFCVAGTASRSFQSVSPSNWSVLTKHAPDRSVVLRRTKSAGTRWSFSTITCNISMWLQQTQLHYCHGQMELHSSAYSPTPLNTQCREKRHNKTCRSWQTHKSHCQDVVAHNDNVKPTTVCLTSTVYEHKECAIPFYA